MDFPPPLSAVDRDRVAVALGPAPGHIEFTAAYALYQSPVWEAIGASDAALEFQEAYTKYRQFGVGTADGLHAIAARVGEELGQQLGAEAVKQMVGAFESALGHVMNQTGRPTGPGR